MDNILISIGTWILIAAASVCIGMIVGATVLIKGWKALGIALKD